MSTITTGIGLLLIAGAILVIFTVITKQGIPLIGNLGSAFGGASKGFSDFFNSFGTEEGINPDPTKQSDDDQLELYGKTLTDDEELIINYNDNPNLLTDEEKKYAEDILTQQWNNDPNNDPSKFNPPNTEYNEDNPYGYDDAVKTTSWNLFPSAYADDSYFSTKTQIIQKPQGSTGIRGDVRSELNTEQQFSAFSSDSSRPVRGVIRRTPRDRTKLLVDSNKKPLETASQRANRVFIETGNFADSSRGASSFKNDFDFGTNTGSASRIPTHGNTSKQRRAEKLRLAAERAAKIFDSRSISNF